MSSTVTCRVSSYPSTTIATESPTRIMSTPAVSTARADGASYAVTITSGVPDPLRATTSGAPSARRATSETAISSSSTVQGTHGSRRQAKPYPMVDSAAPSRPPGTAPLRLVPMVDAAAPSRPPARRSAVRRALRRGAGPSGASTRRAALAVAVQLTAGEEIPPAVGAHLHHVAGVLLVGGVEALELARVDDAAPVGLAQLVAVDVRDVAHVAAGADRTAVVGRVTDVPCRPEELGVGVTDVESG